jgi:membrane associated rhomboid family serine protease
MIKQLILLNSVFYGAYLISSGPTGLLYKKYFTLGGGSSITGVGLCHFSHTSMFSFALNSGVLYTIGNSHALKFGCPHFAMIAGAGLAGATALGLNHVYHNNEQTIAGASGATAALITYNVFKSPGFFKYKRLPPYLWLAALLITGAYNKDMGIIGGYGAGYLAFLFL